MSRTAANHVEEHFNNYSDDKIQLIWNRYSIKKKMQIFKEKIDEISSGERQIS